MRIDELNSEVVTKLRNHIEAELEKSALALGLSIKVGRGKFTTENCTFQLEVAVVGEGGKVRDRTVTDFERLAPQWGLEADDMHRVFEYDGHTFQIVGANRSAPKYPIIARRLSDKKQYKFDPKSVRVGLREFACRE